MKHKDRHRGKFDTGDWTDDSDQMILILLSLIDNKGKVRKTCTSLPEMTPLYAIKIVLNAPF